MSLIKICFDAMKLLKRTVHLTTCFEGKRHGVQPQNGIPSFSLHFPLELSYGYLCLKGNGKIPLGR